MNVIRDENGQVIVLIVFCMAVLLGFVALAIDVGQLLYTKVQLQTAADAAAFAGALEIQQCGSTANCAIMQTAAKAAMTENGMTPDAFDIQCAAVSATGTSLTLNNGPCALGSGDPSFGNSNYVEAVVTKHEPTIFAGILGIRTVDVMARAEAGLVSSDYCLYVSTGNTGAGAGTVMTMNSGGQLDATCGIIDDSGATSALWLNSGSHLSATTIDVHGTYSFNNGAQYSPTPTNYAAAVADPLSWVPQPTVSGCTNLQPVSSKGQVLNPGTYCGVTLNSGASLMLNPGMYVMNGYINVGSGATLSGSGVTLFFPSGTMQMNSGSTVNITAPSSGTYAGILLFQSPSNSAGMNLNSGSASLWQGAIYLPGASLTINSGGNAAAYTIIDVKSLIIDSGAKFNIAKDYSSLPGGSPARVAKLLE